MITLPCTHPPTLSSPIVRFVAAAKSISADTTEAMTSITTGNTVTSSPYPLHHLHPHPHPHYPHAHLHNPHPHAPDSIVSVLAAVPGWAHTRSRYLSWTLMSGWHNDIYKDIGFDRFKWGQNFIICRLMLKIRNFLKILIRCTCTLSTRGSGVQHSPWWYHRYSIRT